MRTMKLLQVGHLDLDETSNTRRTIPANVLHRLCATVFGVFQVTTFKCPICHNLYASQLFNIHKKVCLQMRLCKREVKATEVCDDESTANEAFQETQVVNCDDTMEDGETPPLQNEMIPDSCEQKPFVCTLCDECFACEDALTNHLLTHSRENSFVCSVCNERFFDLGTLADHQKSHVRRHFSSNASSGDGAVGNTASCDICDKVFCNTDLLINHLPTHFDFSCKKCDRRFVDRKSLVCHLLNHVGDNSLTCSVCKESFKSTVTLKSHLRIHSHPFPCPFCGERFLSVDTLECHLTRSHPYLCMCNKRFSVKEVYESHLQTHFVFACTGCGDRFTTEEKLKNHLKTHTHPFLCVCGERFASNESYERHQVVHFPFSCVDCTARFIDEEQLNSHLRKEAHSFLCKVCKDRFSNEEHLDLHLLKHSHPFACTTCEERFRKKAELYVHEKSLCPMLVVTCKWCSERFVDDDSLQEHLRKTKHKYDCVMCEERCKNKEDFLNHLLTAHEVDWLECKVCKRSYSRRYYLMKHLATHDGVLPFACTVRECGERYATQEELNDHAKSHERKVYTCSECSRKCSSRADLNRHLAVHTGEKPFKCTDCDKTFILKHSLLSHSWVHTGVKLVGCPKCDQRFTRAGSLKRHLLKTHK